jgi:hypothetical protein
VSSCLVALLQDISLSQGTDILIIIWVIIFTFSLHTMARLCKRNGILINSMTLQYSEFVDEYLFINEYIKELEDDRVWNIKFKKILDNYIKGKQGLVHAMQVC